MDPAGMMVGMAVGSTLGRHMASTMNNVMNDMQTGAPAPGQGNTPPGIPSKPVVQYNVVVNGQTIGPFDMNILAQMIQSAQITPQTLVWKQGMSGWAAANTVIDFQALFSHNAPVSAPSSHQPGSQVCQKESTVHIYNEKDFYSLDRLKEFGMSTNIAQQMVNNMNHHMKNMFIPGAGNMMQQPSSPMPQHPGSPPPPPASPPPPPNTQAQEIQIIPEPIYFALIDGKQTGPYCETELARLINDKKLTKETYIWYTGISEWTKAENIPTILRLVALVPPPLPAAALAPPPPPAGV